jgi:hypothetical protein
MRSVARISGDMSTQYHLRVETDVPRSRLRYRDPRHKTTAELSLASGCLYISEDITEQKT